MNLALIFILVITGIILTDGKPVNKATSVTFYGKAAERIVQLVSDSLKCRHHELCKTHRPSDCSSLDKTKCPTGIYTIYPRENIKFDVLCEMDKYGGGWTVFQHRQDGSVDFYRTWAAYKEGFGSLKGEFWLGNDHIHQITSLGSYTLRIDLEDFERNHVYAKYSSITLGSERTGYKLHVSGYSGTAGDALREQHNGSKFSTKDRDNDVYKDNCAQMYKGGWWYKNCHYSNLNGLYLIGKHKSSADGVNWHHWKGLHYSLKTTNMMIRRN